MCQFAMIYFVVGLDRFDLQGYKLHKMYELLQSFHTEVIFLSG